MVNQQLLDYIKQQLQQNISREQIKNSLITNGWQALDIDEAFSSMVSSNQPLTPTDTLLQSQSFSTQPSLNKTLLTIISIIGGILIIGGGVFAYFNYFQSPESPEEIVQKMIVKLTEINSLECFGEMKAEVNVGDLLDSLPPRPFAFKIDIKALKKYFKPELEQELSSEQIKQIKIIIQQTKIFKITEKLTSEKIEGVNTHHYKITFDKEGVKKLFVDISQITEGRTQTEEELEYFTKSFETMKLSEGEFWIGKKDLLPYKVSFNLITKETYWPGGPQAIFGKLSFIILLKNFNKPVQIEISQQIESLKDFVDNLIHGLLFSINRSRF